MNGDGAAAQPALTQHGLLVGGQWQAAAAGHRYRVASPATGASEAAFSQGYWFTPTVVTGVRPEMVIMREETFGPVTRRSTPTTPDKWQTRPWNVQRIQPFRPWPGLAPSSIPGRDPDQRATSVVTAPRRIAELTMYEGDPYVGLVQAQDGAAAIASSGWLSRAGAVADTAAVIRSWQERFGARLCSLSMDTLGVSVAWPPTNAEQARRIAAEHYAFCPDLVAAGTLDDRARSLVEAEVWAFWWD